LAVAVAGRLAAALSGLADVERPLVETVWAGDALRATFVGAAHVCPTLDAARCISL
jgi:hypothetical protein